MKVIYGPVGLLVIQGSPFCNIDCTYCYLPDRLNKKRMSVKTVEQTIKCLLADDLIADKISIVWHAGEPLVLPITYYSEVFEKINELIPPSKKIQQHIQTNGMLINQEWCDFFKKHDVRVGVSIDGPKSINDINRLTRNGESTFDKVMEGIGLLRKNNLQFHALAVISEKALPFAAEIFDFFDKLGIYFLGFNVEECEGSHTSSSLKDDMITRRNFYDFFHKFIELHLKSKERFIIREIRHAKQAVMQIPLNYFSENELGAISRPWGTVSVDIDGNFSTFSPELLGQKSTDYGDFIFGNVYKNSFKEAADTEKFKKIFSEILSGIEKCEQTCQYFSFCGGGCPSNKYYENGSFNSTETIQCKYATQVPFDAMLDIIEKKMVEYHI